MHDFLLRKRRLWVRLGAVAALLAAAWLLLIPRTVSYLVKDGSPYDTRVLYSWGTSEQTLIFSELFVDPDVTDPGLVASVRLDCGTSFTSGENEADDHEGAQTCSAMETPRRITGLLLALLGAGGLWAATRLPAHRSHEGHEASPAGDTERTNPEG